MGVKNSAELSATFPQYANVDHFDFEDAADKEPLQQLDVAVGREVGEYAVK